MDYPLIYDTAGHVCVDMGGATGEVVLFDVVGDELQDLDEWSTDLHVALVDAVLSSEGAFQPGDVFSIRSRPVFAVKGRVGGMLNVIRYREV